jgi:hypothetical protein
LLADTGLDRTWREDMTLGSLCSPFLVGMLALQGCAEYRVSLTESEPVQPEGEASEDVTHTVDAYFWGNVLEPQVVTVDCEGEGIEDVAVQRTDQQRLISVVTLGIWMPADLRYRCKAPGRIFPEPKPR